MSAASNMMLSTMPASAAHPLPITDAVLWYINLERLCAELTRGIVLGNIILRVL